MAKSSRSGRLPDPETYGREMAERRRRSAENRQRMNDSVDAMTRWLASPADILTGLRSHMGQLGEVQDQLEALVNHNMGSLVDLENAKTGLGAMQAQINELRQQIGNTARTQDQAIKASLSAIQSRVDALAAMPAQKTDLSAIEKTLDALVARPAAKSERIERQVGPKNMVLQVTGRDDNGDIEFIEVEVTN